MEKTFLEALEELRSNARLRQASANQQVQNYRKGQPTADIPHDLLMNASEAELDNRIISNIVMILTKPDLTDKFVLELCRRVLNCDPKALNKEFKAADVPIMSNEEFTACNGKVMKAVMDALGSGFSGEVITLNEIVTKLVNSDNFPAQRYLQELTYRKLKELKGETTNESKR